MGLLIFFFVLSIFFSFLCSILEAVLLSVTPSYVSRQQKAGTYTGQLLKEYKEDIDRPLSAILTLNTIAHTVGAIGVGAQAGKLFGEAQDVYGMSWESIIAGLMTLAILIFSEIIPKTIGANNWKMLSPFSVRTIKGLIWILSPLVWVSQLITKSMKKDKTRSVLSRADIAAIAQAGEDTGAINKDESKIINNVINFEKMTVRDIMTPRTVAFMLKEETHLEEFLKMPQAGIFSRIPVYSKDKDHITGMVLKDDILYAALKGGQSEMKVKDIMLDVEFVKDDLPLPELFRNFTTQKQHLSVVKDEFGNTIGLVTMEDMIETLLGREIVDESDRVVDLQKYAKEKFEESNGDN